MILIDLNWGIGNWWVFFGSFDRTSFDVDIALSDLFC